MRFFASIVATFTFLVLVVIGCGSDSGAPSVGEFGQAITVGTGPITISGTITTLLTGPAAGITVHLDGTLQSVTTTDAAGKYSFVGLKAGSYSVRPTATNCSMSPDVVNLNNLKTGSITQNFAAGGATCGVDPAGPIPLNRPLNLHAQFPACRNNGEGSSITLAQVSPFIVPSTIAVRGPAAGDETLTLTFAEDFHTPNVCQYQFATATAGQHPRPAALVSCSNGLAGGASTRAATLSLTINTTHNYAGSTNHEADQDTCRTFFPPVASACDRPILAADVALRTTGLAVLPEAFSVDETKAMRAGFSWASTQAVPELDASGRPALYYALIYIEHNEQLGFLDQLQIHHQFLPIFEARDRWTDRVGYFRHQGDGNGVFTFAIVPGQSYNLIRSGALNGTVAFNAIVRRTPPSPFANPDGTVSYNALGQIGFRYQGLDPIAAAASAPTAPILCAVDLGGLVKSFVAGAAGAVQGLGHLIERGIGALFGLATGTNTVGVAVQLLNTDPDFNIPLASAVSARATSKSNAPIRLEETTMTPMVQAWGQDAGFALQLTGARVRAYGLTIPSFDEGTIDGVGHASVTINVNNDSGFCILTESGAADVIDLITSVEICDFRRWSVSSSSLAISFPFAVAADSTNVLAQLIDGTHFTGDIMANYLPRQAHVLVGPYADLLPNALTPCLNLPNLGQSFIQPILDAIATKQAALNFDPAKVAMLGLLGDCIYDVDMIVPSWNGQGRSRGVATHEFGHWLMCNQLFDDNQLSLSTTYNAAIIESILPPAGVVSDCGQGCGNEGFADFISAQIVGGVAYYQPNDSIADATGVVPKTLLDPSIGDTSQGVTMYYCRSDSGNCFENNIGGPGQIVGNNDARAQQYGRFTSTIQDFFDGSSERQNLTSDGNFWRANGVSPLLDIRLDRSHPFSPADEGIKLSGTALAELIGSRTGLGIDQDSMFTGLANIARGRGISWCDVCKLFALHDGNLPVGATAAQSYQVCQTTQIAKWVGPAPDPANPDSCNFVPATSCPSNQVLNQRGVCITPPCANPAPGCTPCPVGTPFVLQNQCVANCNPSGQCQTQTGCFEPDDNDVCQSVVP